MAINKKGLFFTMITILIVGLMVLTFSSSIDIRLNSQLPTIERRVLSVNSFVRDISEVYAERMLRIAVIKSFGYFTENGATENFERDIAELAINGTINDEAVDTVQGFSVNMTLQELTRQSIEHLNIETNITPRSLLLEQDINTGPWVVRATLELDVFVEGDVSMWNMTVFTVSDISIEGLLDPVYTLNGFENVIHKNEFRTWDPVTVDELIDSKGYRAEPLAPSFLNRLQEDNSASKCCGIESLITPINVVENNTSYVDYCFWSGDCVGGEYGNFIFKIDGLSNKYDGFLLDSFHRGVLGLEDVTGDFCKFESPKIWSGIGCNCDVCV